MNLARYCHLMKNTESKLTANEIAEGWHFCVAWDSLLVAPDMPEAESCTCFKKDSADDE